MTTPVVCDASALVAMLLDSGPDGQWATEQLREAELVAPTMVDFEVANIIRRQGLAGLVGAGQTAQAHGDLLDLTIDRWPYEAVGLRVWELRSNLSACDAGYAAVAELVAAPLVTLDRRLSRAPALRCPVRTP